MGKIVSGIFGGGGGGSAPAAPSSQTVTQTSIPEYARPYVERMLGQSEALTNINENPYQTYGGQRIQSFTPMQEQAFQNYATQGVSGQVGTGTGLAQSAGLGSLNLGNQAGFLGGEALGYGQAGEMYGALGASQAQRAAQQAQRQAGMYGMQGAGYGQQAAGAGQQFARMATDPNAVSSYMSPYMQNAIDVQKQEAVRDYQKAMPGLAAQAVRQGAFGGSRSAIERAEASRNLGTQLGNIQATGTQKAYEDAMRNLQFGSNINLQGLQAGMQGAGVGLSGIGQMLGAGQLGLQGTAQGIQGAQAGLQGVGQAIGAGQYGLQGMGQATQAAQTLGQLGQTQFGQEMGISDALAKAGAVQQAQGQQGLDLAYQDFMQQKNYPYQQLAFMSDMLRGLPLSQAAQQQYTAAPSTLSQLGGLGTTALGIYGMSGGFKAAKGGTVPGYLSGGEVSEMSIEKLREKLNDKTLNPLEIEMIQKALIAKRQRDQKKKVSSMRNEEDNSQLGLTGLSMRNLYK